MFGINYNRDLSVRDHAGIVLSSWALGVGIAVCMSAAAGDAATVDGYAQAVVPAVTDVYANQTGVAVGPAVVVKPKSVLKSSVSCGQCGLLKKNYQEKTHNKDVKVTIAPALGLYEVNFADQTFFTDAYGRFAIAGHMIDTVKRIDLTNQKQARKASAKLASTIRDVAIYRGDEKAKFNLVVFTDPDCPYCRKLEEMLTDMPDVRTATILYPLEQLHPKAKSHARSIWCADDREKAFKQVMLHGVDLQPSLDCKAPIEKGLELGRGLGIHGTPMLYRTDGAKWNGLPPSADALRQWLNSSTTAQQ